jgi:hypothetical protein
MEFDRVGIPPLAAGKVEHAEGVGGGSIPLITSFEYDLKGKLRLIGSSFALSKPTRDPSLASRVHDCPEDGAK